MTAFQIDARLAADSLPVAEFPLCSLRLMNDRRFPWLLLIPRRADCSELLDLQPDDQSLLWTEVLRVSAILKTLLQPDKLNVAALGNQVAQLHVHVIARFRSDEAWPQPVWGLGQAKAWGETEPALITQIRAALVAA